MAQYLEQILGALHLFANPVQITISTLLCDQRQLPIWAHAIWPDKLTNSIWFKLLSYLGSSHYLRITGRWWNQRGAKIWVRANWGGGQNLSAGFQCATVKRGGQNFSVLKYENSIPLVPVNNDCSITCSIETDQYFWQISLLVKEPGSDFGFGLRRFRVPLKHYIFWMLRWPW